MRWADFWKIALRAVTGDDREPLWVGAHDGSFHVTWAEWMKLRRDAAKGLSISREAGTGAFYVDVPSDLVFVGEGWWLIVDQALVRPTVSLDLREGACVDGLLFIVPPVYDPRGQTFNGNGLRRHRLSKQRVKKTGGGS